MSNLSIIVSLTSYKKRINLVHKTIESLLQQSLLPEKIILWLSNEEFPNKIQNLPDSLKRLICNKFSIQFCKDIHSYKKLIPTLRLYPDSAIVTVDDDVVYGKNLVSSLVESYKKSPHMIHCCRCHLLQVDGMGNLLPYKRWIWSDSLLEISPSYRNFLPELEESFIHHIHYIGMFSMKINLKGFVQVEMTFGFGQWLY